MKVTKHLCLTVLIILCTGITTSVYSQTTKSPASKKPVTKVVKKYGALAVDRSNGFYYGWASNFLTLAEAEKGAVDECNSRGGKCSVVLSYSGTGCAAYRTIDGKVGTAYGWGLAKTKEEADAIATAECLKRSNGKPAINYVWSCSADETGDFKEIYNASGEIGTVQDIDGNGYNTVKIGNQEWLVENLKTTKYNDGTPIPLITDQDAWDKRSTPAYCWFNNDAAANKTPYGALYNWHAVKTGKLCPNGWHVPSDAEWTILTTYLGGESVAGGKLKEAGTNHWNPTNTGTTNESGFSALPGGECSASGNFNHLKDYGNWWSSSEGGKYSSWYRRMSNYGGSVDKESYFKSGGFSVRCIKD